jgi:phage N-6-adenine-methyltransferase
MIMGKMDVHHSSENKKWETPDAFFGAMDALFHFDLDTCSTAETAKVKKFISPEQDTFTTEWEGKSCWMNPEYGDSESPCKANCEKKKCVKRGHHISEYVPGIKDFLIRAIGQAKAVKGRTVVVLLPARVDTEWFQHVFQNAELILFLRGRLTFKAGNSTDPAPFPSAIAVFGKRPGDEVFEALSEWGNVIDPKDGGIILYTGAKR